MLDILTTSPGTSVIERGGSLEVSTRNGTNWVREFNGTKDEMVLKRASENAPKSYLSPNGDGSWKLTLQYPYGEDGPETETPTDTFELDVNEGQEICWANPRLRGLLDAQFGGSVADDDLEYAIQDVRFSVQKFLKITSQTARESYAAERKATWGGSSVEWKLFYQVAFNGLEHYRTNELTFRRTITAADPVQIQASYENVNCVHTSAEVEADENIPTSNGYFNLPTGKLWLKSHPTVTAAWRGKTQLRYHYTMGDRISYCMYEIRSGGAAVENNGFWEHP